MARHYAENLIGPVSVLVFPAADGWPGEVWTYGVDGEILPVSDNPPRHRFHPLHECPDLDTCSMKSAACFC